MVEEQNATLIGDFVKSVQQICPEHEAEVGDIAVKLGHATREIYVNERKLKPNIPVEIMEQLPAKIAEQEKLKGELESLLKMLK